MAKNKNPFWQSITLDEFLNSEEYKKGQELSPSEFYQVWFNRMPYRPCYQKRNWIFAPFDGIITHIGKYKPDEDVFNVKGQSYTINQILDAEMECFCYACGIFLTAFSVHLGRNPVTGILRKVEDLPCILTNNMYMDFAELGLLKDKKVYPDRYKFAYQNQRRLYEIYDTRNNIDVIVVAIADRNVDSLLDFKQEGDVVIKGTRFNFVCWGSYGLLVVPINRKGFELKPLVKDLDYVYGGQTAIFEVIS